MTHPLSFPGSSGALDMRAGDRVTCLFDGRQGVADEFLSDGDAFVTFDDGTFGTVKWNHLVPAPPLYQVWFIPTERAKTSFGWILKAIGAPLPQEDAALEAYIWSCDGRTPDQEDYLHYRALPLLDA